MTDTLTDRQWQAADAIARQVVLDKTKVNELEKIVAYLRYKVNQGRAEKAEDGIGKQFFEYLKVLIKEGTRVSHSSKTIDYYRSLDIIFNEYLKDYQSSGSEMLLILGWATRLANYYDKGVPTGERIQPPTPLESERKAAIQAIAASKAFKVGQQLEAVIASISKKKVTYQILEDIDIRLSNSEHKLLKAGLLTQGQTLTVEIIELREDGTIKKIKAII